MNTNISMFQYPETHTETPISEDRMFHVVFVSQAKNIEPSIVFQGKSIALKMGQKIEIGQMIRTNSSRIEIRDNWGAIFRLGENSEFSVEQTEGGIAPVYYGEVYKGRISYEPDKMCATSKYRTSCWMNCTKDVFMHPTETNADVFYSFSADCPIWEYDESGRKFTIVHLDEGQKCSLTYHPNVPMRERYTVTNISSISDSEYDYIVTHFINPRCWR